jgi:CHAT domain-containing protein
MPESDSPQNTFNISNSPIANLVGSGSIQVNPTHLPKQIILFLAANPKSTQQLRLDEEVREIDNGLRRSLHRDRFTLAQRWAVRTTDLRQAMLDLNPQIVHFSGHGEGEAGLVFEDAVGEAKLVSTAALAGLFSLFVKSSQPLNCVVLNGCYSEVQAEAIAQHVPHVIGMKQAILDKAAIAFSVGFYDALGAGRSIGEAFEFGRSAIQLEGIADYELPILLERSPMR